jgi:hypothetical protein
LAFFVIESETSKIPNIFNRQTCGYLYQTADVKHLHRLGNGRIGRIFRLGAQLAYFLKSFILNNVHFFCKRESLFPHQTLSGIRPPLIRVRAPPAHRTIRHPSFSLRPPSQRAAVVVPKSKVVVASEAMSYDPTTYDRRTHA